MSEGVPLDEEMFDVAAVEAGAWSPGPYGAGDALGTYNELGSDQLAAALAILDLSRPLRTFTLGWTMYSGESDSYGYECELIVQDKPEHPNQLTQLSERVEMSFNHGTKLNGLHHACVGDVAYGGRRLRDLVAANGIGQLDTPTWGPPVVTRGFVIDVLADKLERDDAGALWTGPDGQRTLPPHYRITVEDLEAAVERQGLPEFRPGDALLIHTGWGQIKGASDPTLFRRGCPGPWLNECRWLASFRPAIVGGERTWGTDNRDATKGNRDATIGFLGAAHQEVFVRFGIRAWERILLGQIVAAGVDRFVYCHNPVRADGAVSSNAPAMAIANVPATELPATATFSGSGPVELRDDLFDVAAVQAGAWSPGPYGPGDSLGTYNEVNSDAMLAALGMLDLSRPLRTFDLGHCIHPDDPRTVLGVAQAQPRYEIRLVAHDTPARDNHMTDCSERVLWSFNIGSKLCGLHHVGVGDLIYGGRSLREIVVAHGAGGLDVSTWGPPILTRGFIIDVLADKVAREDEAALSAAPDGRPVLKDDYRITLEDLEAAIDRQQLPDFRPGDALLIHTGWSRMRDDPRYAVASPGVWLRECRWLGSQRPAVVGTDARIWGSANPAVTRGADGAAHQELFLRFGIRAWESVNLAEIVGAGVDRFVYGHAPTPAERAVSSNTPAFAIANV